MTKPFGKLLKILAENRKLFDDMLDVIPTKFRPRRVRQPIFNSVDEQASWIKTIIAKIGTDDPKHWEHIRHFFAVFDNLPADAGEDVIKFFKNMKNLEEAQLKEIMKIKDDFIDTITWDYFKKLADNPKSVLNKPNSSEFGQEIEKRMVKTLSKTNDIIDLNKVEKGSPGHANFEVIDFAVKNGKKSISEFASITHGTMNHLVDKFKILLKLAGGQADFTFEKMVKSLKEENMWTTLADFRSKAKLYVQPEAVEPLRIFIENHPNINIWVTTTKMSKSDLKAIIQGYILK